MLAHSLCVESIAGDAGRRRNRAPRHCSQRLALPGTHFAHLGARREHADLHASIVVRAEWRAFQRTADERADCARDDGERSKNGSLAPLPDSAFPLVSTLVSEFWLYSHYRDSVPLDSGARYVFLFIQPDDAVGALYR